MSMPMPRNYDHAIRLLEQDRLTPYEFVLAADQLFPHRADDARKLVCWDDEIQNWKHK